MTPTTVGERMTWQQGIAAQQQQLDDLAAIVAAQQKQLDQLRDQLTHDSGRGRRR